MIIKGLILISSVVMAQGPEYTGEIKQAPSAVEKRVNDQIIKTNKKMEIEGSKKEVELRKDAPKNLNAEPAPKKKTPFIVHPKPPDTQDPAVMRDQYDHNLGKDPSTEFEQQVIENRNAQPDMSNEEFVRQFKENAAKAGIKVEVDSNLKARPIKNSNGSY